MNRREPQLAEIRTCSGRRKDAGRLKSLYHTGRRGEPASAGPGDADHLKLLKGLKRMNQYIVRRPSTWATTKEIEGGIAASARVANREMFGQVRWIRCYVVNEPDGRLGMFDVYEAHSPEMLREHARRVGLPSDIYPVETTFIVRADLDQLASAA